jgi:hypothetical protein
MVIKLFLEKMETIAIFAYLFISYRPLWKKDFQIFNRIQRDRLNPINP